MHLLVHPRLRTVVVLLVALSLIATAAFAQEARLERDLHESKSEAADARNKLERLGGKLDNAKVALTRSERRLADAEAKLIELQDRLAAASKAYAEAQQRHADAVEHLEEVTARLERTENELAAQQKVLGDRVASAYKYGGVSITQVLLESDDISDFLNSAKYVGTVMNRDQQILGQIADLLEEVRLMRAEADEARELARSEQLEAEAAKEALEQATAEHAAQTKKVRAQRAENAKRVDNLQADRKDVRSHLHDLVEESERLEAQLAELARKQRLEAKRRAAEEAARAAREARAPSSASPPSGSGGWSWPNSCGRITSGYGSRWGRMHEGVDIACGYGSQLYAARDGVVYSTYCGSGYGNCVLIDHGGGYVTLYGHQSRIAVTRGQRVGAGQVIGFEGSTGHSTGSHLHFEVRVNGSPRNPCSYIGC